MRESFELTMPHQLEQTRLSCTGSFVQHNLMPPDADVVQEVQAMHGFAKALLSELGGHVDP